MKITNNVHLYRWHRAFTDKKRPDRGDRVFFAYVVMLTCVLRGEEQYVLIGSSMCQGLEPRRCVVGIVGTEVDDISSEDCRTLKGIEGGLALCSGRRLRLPNTCHVRGELIIRS